MSVSHGGPGPRLVDAAGKEVRYARLVTDPDAGLTVTSLMTRQVLLEHARAEKLVSVDVSGMDWLDGETLVNMAERCAEHDTSPDDDLLELFNASLPPALREGILIETSHLAADRQREIADARADFMELLGENTTKLRHLDLSDAHGVDDVFLSRLPETNAIEILKLGGCAQLTSKGIACIAQRCRNLRDLDLSGVPCLDDAGLHALAAAGVSLERLMISGCPRISSVGLQELLVAVGSTLQYFDVSSCPGLDKNLFKGTAEACSALQDILLCGNQAIEKSTLEFLTAFGALRTVHLDGCYGIPRHGLEQVRDSCPSIEFLRRRDAPVGLSNAGGLMPHWKPLVRHPTRGYHKVILAHEHKSPFKFPYKATFDEMLNDAVDFLVEEDPYFDEDEEYSQHATWMIANRLHQYYAEHDLVGFFESVARDTSIPAGRKITLLYPIRQPGSVAADVSGGGTTPPAPSDGDNESRLNFIRQILPLAQSVFPYYGGMKDLLREDSDAYGHLMSVNTGGLQQLIAVKTPEVDPYHERDDETEQEEMRLFQAFTNEIEVYKTLRPLWGSRHVPWFLYGGRHLFSDFIVATTWEG
ncbi:F-box/LRR-repeat protein 20 [Hondaea fermentalgiana]|uniref:F-box/LRR-repeat protein 20 n=1 Tax=Hondaea fermentalgiana TaxID=2315210 RepID=A0A2R5GGU5_9STRA|nr:F-box/LRR-repeat protein 20 [Hondaea fermentalgiana]|eukprot:GBG27074.1 F-box/LRR-repeat protein 20 [Hondaea fermentalgiana]